MAARPHTYSEDEVCSTQITIVQFIQGPLLAFQFTVPSRAFAKAQWTTVQFTITLQLATFAIPRACTINTELEFFFFFFFFGGGGGH